MQKFQVFGKNCRNLIVLVSFFVTCDLIEKNIYVQSLKLSSKCALKNFLDFSKIFTQNNEIRYILALFEKQSGFYNALNINRKAHRS